ncbi:hypothetical protein N197_01765 [Helicobacter pylori UM023]|nr:hypothetical protein N197_01765 [Helicobacter pylori UM023]
MFFSLAFLSFFLILFLMFSVWFRMFSVCFRGLCFIVLFKVFRGFKKTSLLRKAPKTLYAVDMDS